MDVDSGIKHLSKSDKALAKIIKEYPKPHLNKTKLYFQSLIKYIIYQQLSTKSAFAIHGRFKKLFTSEKINPKDVIAIPIENFKAIGLSKQKIDYINILAKEWPNINKKFVDIDLLDDNYIGEELMKVKGIGQWTVDMFLIFSLARSDVFPTGDLVIQKGYAKLFSLKKLPSKDDMIKGSEKWKPYRTLACLYLWEIIDGPFEW
tara:strand:+ start:122 stop:733 length:612 start_codon:yes stop_codon:yes gene_type:complete